MEVARRLLEGAPATLPVPGPARASCLKALDAICSSAGRAAALIKPSLQLGLADVSSLGAPPALLQQVAWAAVRLLAWLAGGLVAAGAAEVVAAMDAVYQQAFIATAVEFLARRGTTSVPQPPFSS